MFPSLKVLTTPSNVVLIAFDEFVVAGFVAGAGWTGMYLTFSITTGLQGAPW